MGGPLVTGSFGSPSRAAVTALAGCGGLAQYFNTDATFIRALFVVLALLGGPGLVLYLLMWILVPEEPLGAA